MTNTTSRTEKRKQKQKQKKKKPVWKKILLISLIIIAVIGIGGIATVASYIASAPKIDYEKINLAYASQFYDKDGNVFADMGTENRIKIEYDDLPKVLIDAVTATEDARFFQHRGIDLKRLGGAIIANVRHGYGSEGASTITHQVAEKMFLTPEKKLKIKIQEQWLAFQLEREFSKEQILEMYLNTIFYGSNAYGVAKAAEVYFGIEDLHDLNLVQAAMLAGLPQRPSAYNPFENPDLMQKRVDTVLTLMVRHGKISEQEAEEARKVDVQSVLTDKKPSTLPYEAYRQQAILELEEKLPDVDIYSAGLQIHTNLDQSIQKHVEFLLTDSEVNPIPFPDEDLQAGMAVVDTKTGEIRAIGGSRNRENVMGDNYAIKLDRQPGSTIKPVISYAPAIEYLKWSTYEQINDDKPYETGSGHQIRNWNRKYQGWISARDALKTSLNVPAVKTMMEVGPDNAKKFAEKLGINFADEHLAPQDAIGGTRTTVTPLELAGAFSAFGNEGIYTEPHAVTKVVFPDGSVIDLKPETEAVMADYTAYMVTDMLKDVLRSGTGTRANIPNIPVAGKTGTTNVEGKSGANNSWFVGYSTNYSIGIWAGYSNEHNRILTNTQIPLLLFKDTMTEISKNIETLDFTQPNSVVKVQVEKGTNPPALPSEFTPKENIVTELFVRGTEPSNVSTKFDKLNEVKNLTASYREEQQAIEVSWEYEERENIAFEVSYSVNNGEWKNIGTQTEKQIVIDNVELGASYKIQVVAVDEANELRSEPSTASVNTPTEEEDLGSVQGLRGIFNEQQGVLSVSWQYSGPTKQFEFVINGSQKQIVQTTAVQLTDVIRGETYLIEVTPISDMNRGEPRSITVTIDPPVNNDNDENNDIEQPEEPEEPQNEPDPNDETDPDEVEQQ